MENIILRPIDPERDFGRLAAWFTILKGETSTETGLQRFYEQRVGCVQNAPPHRRVTNAPYKAPQ